LLIRKIIQYEFRFFFIKVDLDLKFEKE